MLRRMNILLGKAFMPLGLKMIALLAFIVLISIGLSVPPVIPSLMEELQFTNLGNLIVWSYWWPLIIIVSIFFGRIWCMVCPVEPVTTMFARLGFRKKQPAWLMSGWAITVFYLVILFVGIEGFEIDHNPVYMAVYMLTILAVSVLTGLLFEKNTFCRYVCPVGYLLGLHARLSFFGWRVKDKMICEQCMDKSCVHKKYIYNHNYKSCGLDLYPAEITDNSVCILCAGCRKTCGAYKNGKENGGPNPSLTYIGFADDLFRLKPLLMAEMFFLWILSGFVISENLEEWEATEKLMNSFPGEISSFLHINGQLFDKYIFALVAFLILPVFFWVAPFVIAKLAGVKLTVKEYFLNYSLAFIPIMAAAHLGKSLLQATAGIPYLKTAFSDVSGIHTAQRIADGQLILQKNPAWLNGFVWMIFCLIMLAGILVSIIVIRNLNRKCLQPAKSNKTFFLVPIFYGSVFVVILVMWQVVAR